MSETYVFEKFGPPIPGLKNSDLCEVMLTFLVLRAVVHLGKGADEEDRFLEVVFKSTRGFRYLDEGDLLPYWSSTAFDNSEHLVHEIKRGGWAEQEEKNGMLNTTAAFGPLREWLIASGNGCLNVISVDEPLVRLL
jgi:hypothetical protein